MVSRSCVALVLTGCLLAALPVHARKGEPDKVVVQHILVGFKKSVPGKTLDRTKQQAKALASDLLRRAEEGEDFDALVKEYTDDRYPGMMLLTNKDAPRVSGGTMRSQVVAKFGDVAFRLEVGEVGMASYHAAMSPYGWHVIKRLE
jgi:foldase protein PrsA